MTKKPVSMPDFKSWQERDAFFAANADYFTIVRKSGVGSYERSEAKSLAQAEALAKTKQSINGGNYLIYAVLNEQSALVMAIGAK